MPLAKLAKDAKIGANGAYCGTPLGFVIFAFFPSVRYATLGFGV